MNLVQYLLDFLGSYTPQVGIVYLWDEVSQTYVEYEQTLSGLAGVDWPWIGGLSLILVCVFCLFKAVGGLFKK